MLRKMLKISSQVFFVGRESICTGKSIPVSCYRRLAAWHGRHAGIDSFCLLGEAFANVFCKWLCWCSTDTPKDVLRNTNKCFLQVDSARRGTFSTRSGILLAAEVSWCAFVTCPCFRLRNFEGAAEAFERALVSYPYHIGSMSMLAKVIIVSLYNIFLYISCHAACTRT